MTTHPVFTHRMRFGLPPDTAGTGRDLAMLNYVLLILGFFTGITPLIAVLLAHARRGRTAGTVRSHLDWQIRLFWRGALVLLAIAVLHAVIVALGAITFGLGLAFLVIPWAICLVWLFWTVWAIARGLHRLVRDLPMPVRPNG